jgi:3-methyladenine DNA glycosylase AlkC
VSWSKSSWCSIHRSYSGVRDPPKDQNPRTAPPRDNYPGLPSLAFYSQPMTSHPIERFEAPMSITAGQPLKDLFDVKLVRLIAESLVAVDPSFDAEAFEEQACEGLEPLTMLQRAAHFAEAMAVQLPEDFAEASELLVASFGPRETRTEGMGLRPFFYMPHSSYIAKYGVGDFEVGMRANKELTTCFTAEFSVRPFIMAYQDRALERLLEWTQHENPNVRRLCSEGSRPRLPWASRLPALQKDPELSKPLLEALKADSSLYVRRSVANHLGDLCKDHPQWVFELCARWIDEVAGGPAETVKERHWMIRHAVRHPAKKKVPEALELRVRAKP